MAASWQKAIAPAQAHRKKARPILDASAILLPGGDSVNSSQLDLPDIHTLKVAVILIRLRMCKRFAIGDMSEFFFRLHIDATTTGLTRVLYRRGGLDSEGELFELWLTVAGMCLKQLTALSGQVKYQSSLTFEIENRQGVETGIQMGLRPAQRPT